MSIEVVETHTILPDIVSPVAFGTCLLSCDEVGRGRC